MYNNKGKRDILIFPKFKNINLIQEVRDKYDRLSNLVEPHITLAFPFKDEIYKRIIPTHKKIRYIPHITLGKADNVEEFEDFNYQFTTIVDEVSIEFIGDNEESIIIGNIKL